MTDSAQANAGAEATTNAARAAEDAGILAAPPTTTRAQDLLLDFLSDHDAACPVCGYNVRALTRPVCPECKQELTIAVGSDVGGAKLRLGWLFVALAPGFFSGIAAVFTLIPVIGQLLNGRGLTRDVLVFTALDLFGWSSLIFAIIIAARLKRFVAMPRARQRWFALVIWIIHITALALFICIATLYL